MGLSCTMAFSSISMNQLLPPRWSTSEDVGNLSAHLHQHHIPIHRATIATGTVCFATKSNRPEDVCATNGPKPNTGRGITIWIEHISDLEHCDPCFQDISGSSCQFLDDCWHENGMWEGRAPACGRFVPNSLQRIPGEGGRTADPPGVPRRWFCGDALGWRPAPRMQQRFDVVWRVSDDQTHTKHHKPTCTILCQTDHLGDWGKALQQSDRLLSFLFTF